MAGYFCSTNRFSREIIIDSIGNTPWGFCCPSTVGFGLVLIDTINSRTTHQHFFQNSYSVIKHGRLSCISIGGKKGKSRSVCTHIQRCNADQRELPAWGITWAWALSCFPGRWLLETTVTHKCLPNNISLSPDKASWLESLDESNKKVWLAFLIQLSLIVWTVPLCLQGRVWVT